MPCGTLSVVDCSRLDGMAELMLDINQKYKFDETHLASLQRMDGYSPTIFFDYGDYVNKLLEHNNVDKSFIDAFNRQLETTVPFKTNTAKYYTTGRGPQPIYTYSGITTSDPSISSRTSEKTSTKWYQATH